MNDPTKRFSTRVENYIKYRPGYPEGVIELLRSNCGLTGESVIADVGSGTGILTEIFLKNGNTVYAVEPNREMREGAERLLGHYPNFRSVSATAEATTLGNNSVDMVTAAQAFHWFDREKAREEFGRILKPDGWVVLIWNDRSQSSTAFLKAFEELLLACGTDYASVNHRLIDDEKIGTFLGSGKFKKVVFPNRQVFDFDGLVGRVASASYAPEPGHENYAPMQARLREIFELHAQNGKIEFEYDTLVYIGKVA